MDPFSFPFEAGASQTIPFPSRSLVTSVFFIELKCYKKIELVNGMMQDGRLSMTVYEIASEKALAMTSRKRPLQ
ncbi:hypothetical protein KSMBR1_0225 [Candidatus Kuenenia stuttgartiensis]|uniref:Uncharacterized protein n=1 Tax=Kuenenia stuttgartiensis TaxID=174633 RepID=A0A2C9CAL4_KUEST|nr:hypothetical protein KSMBR1_0225 [Candidatus Kuenenia stuttgartiensis]